ncbi:MAG: Gfo/Idh/MocA family protein [Planctomycetota bacterium]|jgi:predicted dehydrogenase
MRELGVGLIGYGYMGRMQAFCHRAVPEYYSPPPIRTKLVAAATSREETAERAKADGFEFATADWRELVARDDVDIVHVVTPNNLHAEQTIAALEAGKHVSCDKPPAMTADEAKLMCDAARGSASKLMYCFQNRFLPALLRAKEFVTAGFLGRVLAFRCVYLHSGYVDPDRPISWRMLAGPSGAGALFDLGSHCVDMMLHLAGPVESVNATFETLIKERPTADGGRAPVEVDDAAYLRLRTPDGAVGTIEASRISTGAVDDFRFEIHGDKGAIRFGLMDMNWLDVYDNTLAGGAYGGSKGWTRIESAQRYPGARIPGDKCPVGWTRGHVECLAEFLRCIAEAREPSPGPEEGLAVQRVLEAAQASARDGGWVGV